MKDFYFCAFEMTLEDLTIIQSKLQQNISTHKMHKKLNYNIYGRHNESLSMTNELVHIWFQGLLFSSNSDMVERFIDWVDTK